MHKVSWLAITILVLSLAACNMPSEALSPAEMTATIDRSVALTVAAGTASADQSEGEDTGDGEDEGESVDITETSEPPPTEEPTATPEPQNTPTPSDTPIPCNLGDFVTDVTIPDGTVFEPGEEFTKTWRLKNVGSCAWTSGYDIVFAGGDSMDAPSSVQITTDTVNPGENVDVSVDLIAPATEGTYRGNWQLRDPLDVIFGLENSTSGYFWVEIEVEEAADPETVTLHRSSRSKDMSVGGMSSSTRCGIAGNGDAIRAFLDYDLDPLAGLSTDSTIQVATLDLTDYSGVDCLDDLAPLKAGVIDYGTTPDYPGDFNQGYSATLFEVPSGLGISGLVEITSELQDFVNANGAGHFQFRLELEGDDMGSAFACLMQWPDPLLNITYIP